jgi:putative transposase
MYTAHAFKKMLKEDMSALSKYAVDVNNKRYEFWQRDSLAIHLYTKEVMFQKLDYIHRNPVAERWQLAANTCDYYFSSSKFYETGKKEFAFLKDVREVF